MNTFWQKPLLFVVLASPFIWLVTEVLSGNLIDPIEEITNPTGQWALRFLLLSLLITPLNKILPFSIVKFRRMIGVFSFFYACMHLGIFLIDQQFSLTFILEDVTKRPYIAIGFSAFLLLFLLAITSTNKMIRRLGRRWKQLHKFIYLIAILVILHFYWQVKSMADIEPLIYTIITLFLLSFRVEWKKWLKR
ncbi:MAG: sulfoxide reductase heme-binding subunit YedZ [Gammaproteobacteria bacterium]|uniref:Protein-methionine-sulfoxide reductase heme-binding subunit MsrQ n=1 Tax=endosymbiont of Bathymodiolus septemdierum str. Myojin knoll TaxID=1303921 RepID=A0A0N7KBI7_9GAMM|nr:protein-methionine-sulfoxide reductase heme-binding subunit MsrQ [Bathymodiolus septemdierum thioautotrophic gill symbiont]RUA04190.1 MAG: sulfoxide reductase heme-binding subunit YedZ [Gammaproteobacteria bacterium]BAS68127.1 sulfite oxidase subunit YedZ [endosymbiont of Bathymodiolus septemdierum str. Myojin knoll]